MQDILMERVNYEDRILVQGYMVPEPPKYTAPPKVKLNAVQVYVMSRHIFTRTLSMLTP
jgi:hypothetical protein